MSWKRGFEARPTLLVSDRLAYPLGVGDDRGRKGGWEARSSRISKRREEKEKKYGSVGEFRKATGVASLKFQRASVTIPLATPASLTRRRR